MFIATSCRHSIWLKIANASPDRLAVGLCAFNHADLLPNAHARHCDCHGGSAARHHSDSDRLLFSGTFTRFADIRFIFCHAGGSVPVVAARMTQYGPKDLIEKLPHNWLGDPSYQPVFEEGETCWPAIT
jgi:hypothetical protein